MTACQYDCARLENPDEESVEVVIQSLSVALEICEYRSTRTTVRLKILEATRAFSPPTKPSSEAESELPDRN